MAVDLNIAQNTIEQTAAIAAQARKVRPLRIVMLDDEPLVLEALKLVWPVEYNNAELLTFTDTQKALQEVEREDPDLFTMDWAHPGIWGNELLQLLAARKVKYPVFVISACAEEENVLLYAGPDLNVTLLRKPFTMEQ